MAKNLIDNSKAYIRHYYNNGKWESNPTHKFNGREVSSEAIEFASEFFHFLIESTFLNDATIMWLNSNLGSMREMVETHNNQVEEPDRLIVHAVESLIDYDKRKLKKYFSINMLDEVFAYPDKHLENNSNMLDSLQRKYMKDKQYTQSMCIKIPKDIITTTIDERSWVLLTQLLDLYSKKTVDSINNGTHPLYTSEMFGYFNYLISSKRLNAMEKRRLEQLKGILGVTTYEKNQKE